MFDIMQLKNLSSVNISDVDDSTARLGAVITDVVLLIIILHSMVLNLIIIAALFSLKSDLVRSIIVILINILIACTHGDLGSIMDHIASPVLPVGISGPAKALCNTVIFFNVISSSGRIFFAAFYALTVFIVVRCWNKPVLAPKNTKYFIIGALLVWLLAIIVTIPTLVHEEFSIICTDDDPDHDSQKLHLTTLYVSLPSFILCGIPIVVTPILLIIISCYIKCNTIGEHADIDKALVKFGFFLMVLQGVSAFVQIVLPLLIIIGVSSLGDLSLVTVIASAISDLSRVPTNILIIVFFSPVREKVKKWICFFCCCCCKRSCFKQPANNAAPINA